MTRGAVLVLRPQPGADETAAALAAVGIRAQVAPVLAVDPEPETPASRSLIQRLDEFDAVICVSVPAARFGLAAFDAHWPQLPAKLRWFAVGERTRRALDEWDLGALAPDDERSEGLLSMAPLERAEHVLIVRGAGGREALAEGLRARGQRVEHLVVYARRAMSVELPSCATVAAAVATSAEIVDAFVSCGGARFAEVPLLVPSERVAELARTRGFVRVRTMEGASAAATVRALASLGIVGAQYEGEQQ